MAYYGNTQIKEAVGASPGRLQSFKDGSLGAGPGMLRSFEDGSLGAGPGRLMSFQDGSLGAGPGMLRSFQDGSLGEGCGTLGCGGGMGLALGAEPTKEKLVLDLKRNKALLIELQQGLEWILQSGASSLTTSVVPTETSARRALAGTLALWDHSDQVNMRRFAGEDSNLVTKGGVPTKAGLLALMGAIANKAKGDPKQAEKFAQIFGAAAVLQSHPEIPVVYTPPNTADYTPYYYAAGGVVLLGLVAYFVMKK